MPFSLLIKWFRFAGIVILVCGLGGLSACQENLVEPAYFGTITGTVLDARTNLPIANASVTTNPATSSYVTTSNGKFAISNVPVGRVAITVSKADYTQVVANVTVVDGQTADVSVLLSKTTATALPAPNRPTPVNQATGQLTDVVLSWRPVNTKPSDSLRYDVVLYESNSTSQRTLLTNSRDTTVLATNLNYNTTYFWQVTVRNPAGASAKTDIWSFQTRALPNNRYFYARTAKTADYHTFGRGLQQRGHRLPVVAGRGAAHLCPLRPALPHQPRRDRAGIAGHGPRRPPLPRVRLDGPERRTAGGANHRGHALRCRVVPLQREWHQPHAAGEQPARPARLAQL